ncbi:MAG: DUF192 domain-containing protein [Candidatus Dormibacteraeota bacterium]|nr:DUF192 domain-containing protein [Candidatus Dormibacteraeota bacterium]
MPELYRLETADGREVAGSVAVAATVWSRFAGLMFRRSLADGHGLALRPCTSVHMFFMRFPLDVVFIDGDGRVLKIYAGIKPGRATGIVRKAKGCIELPAGTLARTGVVVGDVLTLTTGSPRPEHGSVSGEVAKGQ